MTKLSEVREGDTLIADAGFECIKAGEHVVRKGPNGLCIRCLFGNHYLEGQEDSPGEDLVGLILKYRRG